MRSLSRVCENRSPTKALLSLPCSVEKSDDAALDYEESYLYKPHANYDI